MISILEGTVERVLPIQEGMSKANKPWKLLSYVIKTKDEKYPKIVMVETLRNLILTEGEDVRLGVEIESREFNKKWYTSVRLIGKVDEEGNLIPLDSKSVVIPEPTAQTEEQILLADAAAADFSNVADNKESTDLPF